MNFDGEARFARKLLLTIRVSTKEKERAEFVAKHHGSNVARIVRRFFFEEAKRIADAEKETIASRLQGVADRIESLQSASKTAESREPRSPPGFRPPKAARKAPAGRPPRAEKGQKKSKR